MSEEDDRLGVPGDWVPPMYALSAVVYAERDGQILLLKRAMGAMEGQWFLPGGAVEENELPEEAAARELLEESGLAIDGELELVGAYPMWVYGANCLQLSYRGTVTSGDTTMSDEHHEAQWVDPAAMRLMLTDEVVESIAQGDERITALLGHIRVDLDRYLARRPR